MRKAKYIVGIVVLLSACLAEQDNPLIVASCDDGIRNQDEEGVDCGGKCEACVVDLPVVAPCESSLTDNVLTLDGLEKPLSQARYFICRQQDYFDYYEIYITLYTYEAIIIHIGGGSPPAKDGIYPIVFEYDMGDGYASVTMQNFYRYSANTGELYVHVKQDEIMVELCEVPLKGNGSEYTLSGRIICE